jgi:hypothetical protein
MQGVELWLLLLVGLSLWAMQLPTRCIGRGQVGCRPFNVRARSMFVFVGRGVGGSQCRANYPSFAVKTR